MEAHSKSMRKFPLFSIYADSGLDWRVTDFDLVNHDNIICTISQKAKVVKIYDTLLPYCFGKQSVVMEYRIPQARSCGNIILCN